MNNLTLICNDSTCHAINSGLKTWTFFRETILHSKYFLLLFKILYKTVPDFLNLQKLIMFYAFINVHIFAGKKTLQLRGILIFFVMAIWQPTIWQLIWQATTILFVKCGLNLQEFIIQKCLKIQDTIHLDFKLTDNFTCPLWASANKQYFITTNFIVDVVTSFKYLDFVNS